MRVIRRHEKDFTVFFDLLAETLEEEISPLYSPIMENFYAQRLNEKSAILANLSFIVEENSVPLFCFLGIVINTENTKKMSFYQNPSISFSNRKITTRKQTKFFLNEINRLLDQFKPLRVEFLDYNFNNIISEFSNFLLSEQIKPKLFYSHSIRLSLPIDKIKSNLRKSYKALIDPRKNGLTLELFDKSNVSFKDISCHFCWTHKIADYCMATTFFVICYIAHPPCLTNSRFFTEVPVIGHFPDLISVIPRAI